MASSQLRSDGQAATISQCSSDSTLACPPSGKHRDGRFGFCAPCLPDGFHHVRWPMCCKNAWRRLRCAAYLVITRARLYRRATTVSSGPATWQKTGREQGAHGQHACNGRLVPNPLHCFCLQVEPWPKQDIALAISLKGWSCTPATGEPSC